MNEELKQNETAGQTYAEAHCSILPTWKECDRMYVRGDELSALETFIHSNEPGKGDAEWRAQLIAVLTESNNSLSGPATASGVGYAGGVGSQKGST